MNSYAGYQMQPPPQRQYNQNQFGGAPIGAGAGPIYLSGGVVHGGYNNGQQYGYGAQQQPKWMQGMQSGQFGQQQGYGQQSWGGYGQLNNQAAPLGQWGYNSNYGQPQPMQQNPMQQRQPVYNSGQIGRSPMGYFRPGSMGMGMAATPFNRNVW